MNKKSLLLLIPFAAAALVGCTPTGGGDKQCDSAVVSVEKSSATMKPGDTLDLKASIDKEGCTIAWSSDNADVATVENGIVTAHANGTAHIIANGKTVCTITVNSEGVTHVTGLSIDTLYYNLKVGDADKQIVYEVKPENADNKELTFVSGNESIVTVSATGLLHAVAVGETTVVVTSVDNPEVSKTINVTVAKADVVIPAKTVGGFTRLESGELEDGAVVEMISQTNGEIFGLKKYTSGNNIPGTKLSISSDKVKETADVEKYTVVKNDDGTFSFKDSSNKYLNAAGTDSNRLIAKADLDSKAKFNVTITNGLASIVCADPAVTRGTMCFNPNSGNPIFNCYAKLGTYNQISFYVKDQGEQKEVDHIAIEGTLTKTSYNEGDAYEPNGLSVIAYYKDGTNGEVVAVITPSKPTAEVGDTSITFSATYEEKSATTNPITVTVQGAQPIPVDTEYTLTAATLGLGGYADGKKDGIAWTKLMKGDSDSIQGNSSKSSKLWNIAPFSKPIEKVTLTMAKDSTGSTGSMVIGSETFNLGKETDYPFAIATPIVITPTNESAKFEFNFTGGAVYFASIKFEFAAEQKVLTKIEVQTPPSKTEYYQGDTLNTAGMVVMGTYEGDPTPVDVTSKVTVSPTVLDTIGDSIEITVTLGEQHDTFNVKVSAVPTIQSLTIDADDMNKDYKDGETISLEGVEVYANYEGGGSALLTSDKYTLTCDPTEADYDSQKTTLTASLVDTSAGVPDATLDVTLNVSEFVVFTKATNVAIGDVVSFVCEGSLVELTGFENNIGKQSAYTEYINHTLEFEVVAGAADGQLAFKNGDNYLELTVDDNKLGCSTTSVTANSSWTVSFDIDGNAVVTSVAYPERSIRYNSGSPRFACYKGTQNAVQLYMAPRTVRAVAITAVNKTVYEGDTLELEDVDVTITYSNGVVMTGAHPTSLVYDFSTAGDRDLIAKVGDVASEPFKVNVQSSRVLTGVEITSYPESVEVGTVITKEDVKVTLTYSKGDPETDVTPDSITVGDTSKVGSVELTATVGDITSEAVEVTVKKADVLSPIELSVDGGTNAEKCVVQISEEDPHNGIKCGTTKNAGTMQIVLPEGATKVVFYAAGWSGTTPTLTVAGLGNDKTFTLKGNSGISSNSPFTLSGVEDFSDFRIEIVLDSPLASETTITLSAQTRFVVWDAAVVIDQKTVTGIEITDWPKSVEQNYEIKPEEVEVTLSYDDGTSATGKHPELVVCDTSETGTAKLTATAGEVTSAEVDVTVTEPVTVTEVVVTDWPKSVDQKTVIAVEDVKVTVSYSDGTSKENINPESVSCDTAAVGTAKLVATVGGVNSAEVDVTVNAVEPAKDTTVTKAIADISGTTSDGTKVSNMTMDSVISLVASSAGNNGKVYSSGAQWRFYQGDSGTLTINAAEGYVIKSFSLTFTVDKTGIPLYDGTPFNSGDTVDVNGLSSALVTIGNSGTANNGQVRITSITVVYCAA